MKHPLSLLGIPVIKIKRTKNYEKRYFLGVQYRVKKYTKRYHCFTEAFLENVPFVCNRRIQVIMNNLGEALMYARTVPFWHKQDALVFGVRPQHVDIFKMFAPTLPVFFCGEAKLSQECDCDGNHFEAVLPDDDLFAMNDQGFPLWRMWEKYLRADFSHLTFSKAAISEIDKQLALKKLRALHINPDKFVLFMPNAASLDPLPASFWTYMEKQLKQSGFDVLYNTNIFSIPEAYAIAQQSKAVLALRSGFNDVLCELSVPQFIIYTRHARRQDRQHDLQPMYSFKNFPWASHENIFEYNTLHEKLADIQKQILKQMGITDEK